MDAVEVSYSLGDMYAVTFQSWRRLALKILILFGVLIAAFIALPIIMDGESLRETVCWFPWGFYLGLVAFLLLFLFGACPLISYFRLKRQGLLGPNQFEFSNDGVRLETRKGESLIYWSAVTRFVTTKNRLFLFIGPANALVLPRRAFGDQGSFNAVIANAKAQWSSAKE